MNSTKIFGWILLAAGLAIIFWVFHSSYNIFTAKAEAPEVFKSEIKEDSIAAKGKIPTTLEEMQAEVEKMIGEQLKGILPVETIPNLLNLVAWSIFAGISIFAGAQVSNLGIKLIKK